MADSFQVRATLNMYTTCNLGMASAVSLKSHYFRVLGNITIKNVFGGLYVKVRVIHFLCK